MDQIPEPAPGATPSLPTRPVGGRPAAPAATPVRPGTSTLPTRPVGGRLAAPAPSLGPAGARSVNRSQASGLALAAVMILAALVAVVLLVVNPGAQGASAMPLGQVLEFPDQGHVHIAVGQPHPTYETNPPNSGWHREEFPSDPTKFVYDTMMDDEVTVHLMEHANLIAWYSCAGDSDCATIRDSLANETKKVPQDANLRLYVMPRPALPSGARIALGAWQHLLYLHDFDQQKVHDFIKRFGGSVQENMSLPTATP